MPSLPPSSPTSESGLTEVPKRFRFAPRHHDADTNVEDPPLPLVRRISSRFRPVARLNTANSTSSAGGGGGQPSRRNSIMQRLLSPVNGSDLGSLQKHWDNLLKNEERYTSKDREQEFNNTIPPLAKRWATITCLQKPGETEEDRERRLKAVAMQLQGDLRTVEGRRGKIPEGGGHGEHEQQLQNLDAETRLLERKLRYLRERCPEASSADATAHIPLDRHRYVNHPPAWQTER